MLGLCYIFFHYGGVAKLVIASACQAEDRGFKPRHSRKKLSENFSFWRWSGLHVKPDLYVTLILSAMFRIELL